MENAKPINQCDGCRVQAPLHASGNHAMPDGGFMGCTKTRYLPTPAPRWAFDYVDIVFDGPPSVLEAVRFIEVEDALGNPINFAEWVHRRDDRYWVLRISAPTRVDTTPIYQTSWRLGGPVWGDVPEEAYDDYIKFGYADRRIVHCARTGNGPSAETGVTDAQQA